MNQNNVKCTTISSYADAFNANLSKQVLHTGGAKILFYVLSVLLVMYYVPFYVRNNREKAF